MRRRKVEQLIDLLIEYGEAKFGDEWWPGYASPWIGKKKGRRLIWLLDQFDLETLNRERQRLGRTEVSP